MDIYVARQPVFNENRQIYGYELLFRDGLQNAFPDIDGNTATSSVLSNTFFSFELKEILGGHPGLINFTKDLILQKTPLILPSQHIIIEVLENIEPTWDVIVALEEYTEKGFTIALDDFVYHEKYRSMMGLCKIIKFDLLATPLDELGDIINDIKIHYDIILLAEKVETYAVFEQAKQMGFQLFQGYFFSKPEILSKKEISTTDIARLKLIDEIGRTDFDFSQIESIIKNDVSISIRLLKFVNSAYFEKSFPINTIKEAITYLGADELKKFIHIVTVGDLGKNKPNELIRTSVVRGRMCELCGTVLRTGFSREELFMLGLFSLMDALLDRPMKALLEKIGFSEKIKNALLQKNKEFSTILHIVTCFEQGNWETDFHTVISDTPAEKKLPGFYLDAVRTADAFFT